MLFEYETERLILRIIKPTEAAQVLEKWDLDERVGLSADEKGRLIALCYKMLADGAVSGDLSALLAAVTRVVRDGSNV